MKEHYLHYLWKHRMIPLHRVRMSDGTAFKVIQQGQHNQHESGPDFSDAIIEIDGLKWCGNIEIHVNAKDWYLHQHHKDRSYNNVVLHVVYHDDGKVIQNGREIPQIEIKHVIDEKHYQFFSSTLKPKPKILCSYQLNQVPQELLEKLIDQRIQQRLSRKSNALEIHNNNQDPRSVSSFHFLARAMGTKVNKLAFELLATRFCFSSLVKLSFMERHRLLLLVSGMREPQNHEELMSIYDSNSLFVDGKFEIMSTASWKTKGMRCKNWLDLRMKQFTLLVGLVQDSENLIHSPAIRLIDSLKHLIREELINIEAEWTITKDFFNHLMINWIVPYMFWLANDNAATNAEIKVDLTNKAIELLKCLKPEKNITVDLWKQLGVKVNNAYTSQALLENYSEFCTQNKCLTCNIGKFLLSS